MVGVPPLGGFRFPAEAGTPTNCHSHLENGRAENMLTRTRGQLDRPCLRHDTASIDCCLSPSNPGFHDR